MISWLVDHSGILYWTFGLLIFGLAVLWWMNRGRKYLIAMLVPVGLALLVLLISFLVDTDQKQIQRGLDDMSAGVSGRDVERIFRNISEQFRLGSVNRDDFRRRVAGHLQRGEVESIALWDLKPLEINRETRKAVVTFLVKGRSNAGFGGPYKCKAAFVLDPDNQWRMQTFDLYQPLADPTKGDSVLQLDTVIPPS